VVDVDALHAAGIADARRRAALLEYLDSLGFSAEEMVDAERHGRLFGLAGDALQLPGRPILTSQEAAERLGLSLSDVERAWVALGLNVLKPDEVALSQADLEVLRTWTDLKGYVGDDRALSLLRVIGATLSRLAEALSTVVRAGFPAIQLEHTHDELATARAYREIAEFVPRTGDMIDTVLRHHLTGARTYFEGVITDTSASVTCGVGFADLSGFTALTQRLTPVELSDLLIEFAGTVSDVVHTDGGRVVKFIGDEVMWVTSTPELLLKVAVDLVEHPQAREAGLQVRAGLGFGPVLAIGGDYFGTPVNLAARLVAAALPGQILAAADVRDALPDWPAARLDPLTLKGFETPVTAFDLHDDG
jgi:adenylate cyclase